METPLQKRPKPRPITCLLVAMIVFIATITTGSVSVEATTEVMSTKSYTLNSNLHNRVRNPIATGGALNLTSAFMVLNQSENYEIDRIWLEKEEEDTSQGDRTLPIYEVYKNGINIEVPVETQWIIRDFAEEYGFDEKLIFGLALAESTFNPNCTGDSERSLGLYQIQRYWINGANIPHFTNDYANRNLFDPYDATLTLMEMWLYAVDGYDIDISTEQGMKDLLYWHNTGKFIRNVNWAYSNEIFHFANELVELQ